MLIGVNYVEVFYKNYKLDKKGQKMLAGMREYVSDKPKEFKLPILLIFIKLPTCKCPVASLIFSQEEFLNSENFKS